MAKAALEAINGCNLFGDKGSSWSVIYVDIDAHNRNRSIFETLLPRESSSKVGSPQRAVYRIELIRFASRYETTGTGVSHSMLINTLLCILSAHNNRTRMPLSSQPYPSQPLQPTTSTCIKRPSPKSFGDSRESMGSSGFIGTGTKLS
jgi:hypothetical protein